MTLYLNDGPLGEGHYRFRVAASITDRVGNSLDGDADGTGGDAYQRVFDVTLPAAGTFEGRSNWTYASATPLELVEGPADSGYFTAWGVGSQDPVWNYTEWADADFWSFAGRAGDRVAAQVSGMAQINPRVALYGPGDVHRTTSEDEGPNADAYISHYVLPADGTYYVVALKHYYQTTPGNYRLRGATVDTAGRTSVVWQRLTVSKSAATGLLTLRVLP